MGNWVLPTCHVRDAPDGCPIEHNTVGLGGADGEAHVLTGILHACHRLTAAIHQASTRAMPHTSAYTSEDHRRTRHQPPRSELQASGGSRRLQMVMQPIEEDAKEGRAEGAALTHPHALYGWLASSATNIHGQCAAGTYR